MAEKIRAQHAEKSAPLFVGVNGCQGSGKSTLSDFIADYLTHTHNLNVVAISLDDFYLSREKRANLAQIIHPLFSTRGVPGTHNTALLEQVLIHVKNRDTHFSLPAFDKATDNPLPEQQWSCVDKPIDILVFEGWCWGAPHQSSHQLEKPINDLERVQDPDLIWRHYVNSQLKCHFEPLYEYFDSWLLLQAPSFDCVFQWRLEQENKLKDKTKTLPQSKVMSENELRNFISYFQRLTMHAGETMTKSADTVFYLNEQREISHVVEKEQV